MIIFNNGKCHRKNTAHEYQIEHLTSAGKRQKTAELSSTPGTGRHRNKITGKWKGKFLRIATILVGFSHSQDRRAGPDKFAQPLERLERPFQTWGPECRTAVEFWFDSGQCV